MRRLGPVGGDAFAVPAQQRVGCDDPVVAESAGERCCDRAEQAAVVVVEVGPVDLSAQDGELVAKHDVLEVFGATGAHSESSKCCQKAVEDTKHRVSMVLPGLVDTHARLSEPHRRPASRSVGTRLQRGVHSRECLETALG